MYFFGFLREGGVCAPSDTELDVGAHRSAAEISVDINHTGQNKCLKQLISSEKVHIFVGRTDISLRPEVALLAYHTI